ncbi:MAG TPA: DUF1501 domain-containing protein [Tepidisphaeraceae bacterium]
MLTHLSTRRIFLQRGLAILAAAPTIPSFLDQTMMALADPLDVKRTQRPTGKDASILVVVQLAGGNDGLNTVIPYADDHYHRARPALGHDAKDVLKIDSYIGLHPNLTALKKLYDDGHAAIIQGVGYPNPNRSHFRSMDIWQSAQPERETATSGWLGRYFDATCAGADPHVGVAIGEVLPLAMQGERITPLAFERPESYRYNGRDKDHYLKLNQAPAKSPTTKPSPSAAADRKPPATDSKTTLDFLHRTAMDAQVSSDDILRITGNYHPTGEYPRDEFGNSLRTVAAMIAGGLPTRVYYVSLGGFDTHANERGRHDQLMKTLSDGLDAFFKDLKAQKNDDRVLMMTFSEFGRRVEQNASGGTDHGAAAPMFLIGPTLIPGLAGKHPSLTDLDQGDLKHNTDFRNVYAAVLQDWLKTPSKPVLGEQFKPLPIL